MVESWDTKIGTLDWDVCGQCQHSDPVEGGCSEAERDKDYWTRSFRSDGDYVYCGLFKQQKEPDDAGCRRQAGREARRL